MSKSSVNLDDERTAVPDGAPAQRSDAPEDARTVRAMKLRIGDVELVVFDVPAPIAPETLTCAEREIAELVLDGLSNREIAARRGASAKTVANQLRRIYQKLGISSRFELTARIEG